MKILSSFTHPHVVPIQYDFITFVEHKRRFLRNVLVFGDQVNGHQNRLVINILQNVFFCVLQKNNIWVSDLTKKEVNSHSCFIWFVYILQDFPWIVADEQEVHMEEAKLIPLKTMTSDILKVRHSQLFCIESQISLLQLKHKCYRIILKSCCRTGSSSLTQTCQSERETKY